MLICKTEGCHLYAVEEGLCADHHGDAERSRRAEVVMLENRVKNLTAALVAYEARTAHLDTALRQIRDICVGGTFPTHGIAEIASAALEPECAFNDWCVLPRAHKGPCRSRREVET